MSTPFKPLQIPPGVVATPTKNMSSSNWAEANLMRWVEGELQPVGGTAQYQFYHPITDAPIPGFASRCKAIHGWYDLQEGYWLAYVCEQHVYIYQTQSATGGTLTEITPGGGWAPPTVPGQGGYGDLAYGAGNYGTPRATSSILAIDQIPDVWSVDNFGAVLLVMSSLDGCLLFWDPANGPPGVVVGVGATAAWAIGATTISIITAPGGVVPGMAVFNNTTQQDVGTVQSVTASTLTLTAGAVSAGSSGNTLYFGNILQPVRSSQAAPYNNVPIGRGFVVTSQRFVIMFGTTVDGTTGGGSFRRFGWCDQGDYTNWNYSSVTNQAGYLDIEPASPIITACSGRFGTLMFTAKKAYIVNYLGLPYIYNYVELADNCTPWSALSISPTSSYVLWMSEQGMFSFDGTVIAPVSCTVRKWITDNIDDVNVRNQAFAFHNESFSEFWWFFPAASNPPYNSLCVIYNYKEGWWAQGYMARSAGVTASYTVQPILANGTIAYQHEYGLSYSPDVTPPYAETFDLNIAAGTKLTTLKQIIPDVSGNFGNIQFQFWASNSRSVQGSMAGNWSPPTIITPKGFVDVQRTGRDIRMKISMIGLNTAPWTMGQHLYDAVPRGDR